MWCLGIVPSASASIFQILGLNSCPVTGSRLCQSVCLGGVPITIPGAMLSLMGRFIGEPFPSVHVVTSGSFSFVGPL